VPGNIYSSDDVREEFTFLYTDLHTRSLEKNYFRPVTKFLLNPCESGFLRKIPMADIKDEYTRYIYEPPKNYRRLDTEQKRLKNEQVPFTTSYMPGLEQFIKQSYKHNTVYDRLIEPNSVKNLETLINKIREIKSPTKKVNIIQNYTIRTEYLEQLFVLELLMFQYIRYNFIYKIARWIHKYTNVPLDEELYNKINGYIDESHHKYTASAYDKDPKKREGEDLTSALSMMFDYVAISNVLYIYDETRAETNTKASIPKTELTELSPADKHLVWISAGGAHNSFTESFLISVFKDINDPLTNTNFSGFRTLYDSKKTNIAVDPETSTTTFTDFVAANPHFGLIDYRMIFDVSQIGTYSEKDVLLAKFKEMIRLVYRHVPDKQVLTNLLDNLDVTTLQLLIPTLLNDDDINTDDLPMLLGKSKTELVNAGVLLAVYDSDEENDEDSSSDDEDDNEDSSSDEDEDASEKPDNPDKPEKTEDSSEEPPASPKPKKVINIEERKCTANPALQILNNLVVVDNAFIKKIRGYFIWNYMSDADSVAFKYLQEGAFLLSLKSFEEERLEGEPEQSPDVKRLSVPLPEGDIYDYDDYLTYERNKERIAAIGQEEYDRANEAAAAVREETIKKAYELYNKAVNDNPGDTDDLKKERLQCIKDISNAYKRDWDRGYNLDSFRKSVRAILKYYYGTDIEEPIKGGIVFSNLGNKHYGAMICIAVIVLIIIFLLYHLVQYLYYQYTDNSIILANK
jgi:hypothetical protein